VLGLLIWLLLPLSLVVAIAITVVAFTIVVVTWYGAFADALGVAVPMLDHAGHKKPKLGRDSD
jgi:hypothetical protein